MTSSTQNSLPEDYQLLIDGESVPAESGDTLTAIDPATAEPLAEVAAGKAADVDRAVESAREAFEDWRTVDPAERGRILHRIAERIREERDRLAEVEILDNGKPISEARGNVDGCARYFEYYAGVADEIQGDTIPLGRDYVDFTVREPIGVSGQIIPWNFPISLAGRGIAPALAAGNAVVAKPAEQTPLSAIEVGKLALDAGLPPGLLNVIPGFGGEAGAALAAHPDVDGIRFTGSVPTGQSVAQSAVENVNHVHLELGGKSPNVVFLDAPFEKALEDTITAIFSRTSGQVCSAGSRLLIHEEIHDEFLDVLIERIRALTVGPGMDDPDAGPLVSREQFDKVTKYLDLGTTEVGEPVVGGAALDREGYFVEPTIFDGVDNDTRIAQEEIFGPVLSVIEFADEAEAIRIANDSQYGLVAGIFIGDIGRANRFAREVEAGTVYINEWFGGGARTPFGRYKMSGFGREKGLEALDHYTHTKSVCARIDL